MKNLISLTILLLLHAYGFSQYNYPSKEISAKVLKTTLIVQLLEEQEEVDMAINNVIKEIFKENWTLTPIDFHTLKSINSMKKDNKEGYTYLTSSSAIKKEIWSKNNERRGSYASMSKAKKDYVAFAFSYHNFKVETYNSGELTTVTDIGFANSELTSIDFLFLCQQLTRLIDKSNEGVSSVEFYNVTRNIEKVKGLKLVLPLHFFKEKDIKKMNSYYTYDYELVDVEKYHNVVLSKNKNITYAKIVWSNQQQMYEWCVVNGEDGSILSQLGFGGVQFGVNHDANAVIKAKHLKYVTSESAQNFNNRYK